MDDIIEGIFELIFEIIVEGSLEVGTSKKVPLPLRILAFILFVAIFGGFVIFFMVLGFDSMKQGDTAEAVILFVVAIGLLLGCIHIIRKKFKERSDC